VRSSSDGRVRGSACELYVHNAARLAGWLALRSSVSSPSNQHPLAAEGSLIFFGRRHECRKGTAHRRAALSAYHTICRELDMQILAGASSYICIEKNQNQNKEAVTAHPSMHDTRTVLCCAVLCCTVLYAIAH